MHECFGMHTMFWGMGGWMFLLWIFVILIVVMAVSFFFRQESATRVKSALDLLKERYARGEISKQEYEEVKRDIL